MKKILDDIIHDCKFYTNLGNLADYIPILANGNKKDLGLGIYNIDNTYIESGDTGKKFSIQSVSKIFSLICALNDIGLEKFLMKVDLEPSGDRFNSLIKLETVEKNKPLNPFINGGAITTISLIKGSCPLERFEKILDLIKKMTNNDTINYNEEIYLSEKETGHRNKAIAYFLKGANILEGDVDEILETYFKICSVEARVEDMAKAASVIANNGIAPWSGERLIKKEIVKIVRAVMCSCGLYDGSGNFAVNVGIPAKSGVGGLIIGIVPNKMGIATFGPALDNKGNSIGGIKVYEELSKRFNLSIF